MGNWLIYGANGYTGRLVTALAVARGHRPVLAGRDAAAVGALAAEHGLEHRVADLRDEPGLRAALEGMDLVAHCAGPYSATSAPMVAACLDTRTHYVDVTGETRVFEAVLGQAERAAEAEVVLLPGAGFDVVPTDCLANLLAAALPGATALELAFRAPGGLSRGTALTSIEAASAGVFRRVDGELRSTPVGEPRRQVAFPSGPRDVGAISWGDLVTAAHSTGIQTITVYTQYPVPRRGVRAASAVVRRLLGYGFGRALARRAVHRRPAGPDERTRANTICEVWGEVRDAAGRTRTATLTGPNAYDLTADAMVRVVGHVLAGTGPAGPIAPGAHTPATALGADFVRELDRVTVTDPAG